MGRLVLISVLAVIALALAGCSSSPEESLAASMCEVLTEFQEAPEDEADILATEEKLADLALQGDADGVSMTQVEAKLQLECTDAMALYLSEREDLLSELRGIQDQLDEFMSELEG